jgi:phosphoglucosamine mutase
MNNLFGTDGIRNTIGSTPLTQQELIILGKVLGQWIVHKYGPHAQILVGYDPRLSSYWVKTSILSGLLLNSIQAYDAGIIPTPVLCLLTQKTQQFDCGIIISASHNPYHDNGIKVIDSNNGKINYDDEIYITELFYYNFKEQKYLYDKLGSVTYFENSLHYYFSFIKNFFKPDFLAGKKIVLDCAHGATSNFAPTVFKQYGAETFVINNSPNGTNINQNCGSVYPSSLQQAVLNHKAFIGFSFDGDGDRVIAVNNTGIIKDGDDLIALLSMHPDYSKESVIVGTTMSNYGLEKHIKEQQKKFIRASVGDKYVAQQLNEHNALLGGEQSGHIIMRDYLNSGDGIFTALRIAQIILQTNNLDMISFTKAPQVLINLAITHKKDLKDPFLADLIHTHEMQLKNGRLLVRYSGTEPVIRIMAEDADKDHAYTIAQALAHELKKYLIL